MSIWTWNSLSLGKGFKKTELRSGEKGIWSRNIRRFWTYGHNKSSEHGKYFCHVWGSERKSFNFVIQREPGELSTKHPSPLSEMNGIVQAIAKCHERVSLSRPVGYLLGVPKTHQDYPTPPTLFWLLFSTFLHPCHSLFWWHTPYLVAQNVKSLPAMEETWVASLGWEDLLEKGMATYSSIFAWRIP